MHRYVQRMPKGRKEGSGKFFFSEGIFGIDGSKWGGRNTSGFRKFMKANVFLPDWFLKRPKYLIKYDLQNLPSNSPEKSQH